MSNLEFKGRYRRNLPHIQPADAMLFVTFHLAGSIPCEALERWRAEKRQRTSTIRQRHERLNYEVFGEKLNVWSSKFIESLERQFGV